ncbi:hypothetical protein FACS189447_09750 [Spirochaetia bacterium]|nr:hypothetical protein FACS189447_09750 [Spirochaetia bacterium]
MVFEWDPEKEKKNVVRATLKLGEKPTNAQIAEIRAASQMPVIYSADAPRLSEGELAEFKKVNAENRKKVNCTLRLSKKSLEWWKSLGDGYTSAMSRMLEEAQNYPELLKKII